MDFGRRWVRGRPYGTGSGRYREWRGGGGGSRSAISKEVCRFFNRANGCRYGTDCRFSHDLSSSNIDKSGPWTNTAVEETFENKQAKADYNVWKRQIKFPPQTDNLGTVQRLWDGALEILNGDERDWKQMVPRDLDHEEYHGRQHIKIVMDMRVQSGDYEILIRRVSPFLLTITHPIFLDCLSVDTFVGGLYNFISGTNGTRAVPSFQHLCTALVQTHVNDMATVTTDTIERTLAALSTALRELIQREPRCRFNDDLPSLLESIGNALRVIIGDESSRVSTVILNQIGEMQVILSRAKGLLVQENDQVQELSTIVVPATYPHTLIMPRDLHDNDKSDVTHIKIFPTREEILSDVAGYLPTTDLDQPHFLSNQVERHIDTHFRLLRHDTFGELKYSLGGLMHAAENDPAQLDNPRLSFGDFQAYHYTKASVSFVSFDSRRGLEVIISFPQPSAVRNKSAYERLGWWEDSRRLPPGVLLSFVSLQDGKSQHLFLTVTERSIDASEDKSLVKDDKQANIIAKLTNQDQTNIESVVRLSSNKVRGVLVEFPGVLPATFVPILENLQNMQRLGRLPFRQWILPERIDNPQEIPEVTIRPPLYARQLGFAFPLKSVLRPDRKDTRDLYLSPNSSGDYVGIIEELDAETELDRGQCRALVAALTREYALIQGPPGTGKSYLGIQLMKVLISCKEIVELGPIVVVCYTNHALDQFLEHLISINVRKIIRIGGQSQSSLLQGHNLRVVSQLDQKSRSENYHLATSFEGLDKHTKQITRILDIARSMTKRPKWKSFQYHLLENHLLENYERIYHQFSQVDEEGYRTVGRPFELWAPEEIFLVDLGDERETNRTGEVERIVEKAETNIHTLSRRERHCLVQFWCRQIYDQALNDLFEEVKAADVTQGIITNVHDEVDRRVLQDADVIGITTTGLAKRISTLKHVKCKVIICEEAGEVMEPHMISALLPTVEHFIQIGDHEQLRPQINNHSLSLESKQGALYQLDRSQFERLSVGVPGRPKMPLAQLNIQRRMRPEISTLIRSTIYPELRDHQSIVTLPDVVGMRKNVFWLDHNHFEEGQLSEMHHKSHSNIWEAEMVHALVRHIIRQGAYKSSEIAILTPYTGQLQLLRFALRNDFEIVLSDRDQDALEKNGFNNLDTVVPGEDSVDDSSGHRKMSLAKKKLSDLLRVATVDNFQGEEAKVVIVSLVRSNEKRKVGFLRTKNRINVLLSRAQHGMYLIGNTTTYSEIPMWHSIVGLLRATASVNTSLGLCCPRHKETTIEVLEPNDFPRFSPEGGCRQACLWRLSDCGHMCQARCHSESMHNVFSCQQPCQRLHQPCGHPCQKKTCGEDCGRCLIKLSVDLPCGHLKDIVPCHLARDPGSIICDALLRKVVPGCGHEVDVACHESITSPGYLCTMACGTILPCGHTCPGTCGICNTKSTDKTLSTSHQNCRKICSRPHGTCSHICRKPCHSGKDCGQCLSPCEVRCQHSRCILTCNEACAPCIEMCTWSCEHQGDCNMPCSAPCDRLPCDRRCSRALPCGHQCPSICGETCPEEYCTACGRKQDSRVDLLEMKTYAEIDVNETPIVVLGCGHFFTAETLDGLIGMHDAYVTNTSGQFTGLADMSGALSSKVPQCPDCQRPVQQYITKRYNRVVNRAVVDEMSKRFLINGKTNLRVLEVKLRGLEKALEESRSRVCDSIGFIFDTDNGRVPQSSRVTNRIGNRYEECKGFLKDVKQFLKGVSDRYQPAHRLHEATIHAAGRIQSKSVDKMLASLSLHGSISPVERDRRVTLAGRMMQIEVEYIVLEDKFSIATTVKSKKPAKIDPWPGGSPQQLAKPFLETCGAFIAECNNEHLPKLAVEASLCHARVAQFYRSSGLASDGDRQKAAAVVEEAKQHLEKALHLCGQPFQHAKQLRRAVQDIHDILQKERYEAVTRDELAAIKQAIVSGPDAIATHSGHWYNCVNGHPFAIGECGMPMEQARCPECGAPIGGSNHQTVAGVTRALDMEGGDDQH